jgi:hypothetical protein
MVVMQFWQRAGVRFRSMAMDAAWRCADLGHDSHRRNDYMDMSHVQGCLMGDNIKELSLYDAAQIEGVPSLP